MLVWQLLCAIGIAFIILEIFTPSMFFLNFAVASFITAIVSIFEQNAFALVLVFFVLSFLSFVFLRPIILRKVSKETETGVEGKYIDKIANVEEDVCVSSGVITIYGERWEARSNDNSVIPKGCKVRIIRNESIIMFVEKVI